MAEYRDLGNDLTEVLRLYRLRFRRWEWSVWEPGGFFGRRLVAGRSFTKIGARFAAWRRS